MGGPQHELSTVRTGGLRQHPGLPARGGRPRLAGPPAGPHGGGLAPLVPRGGRPLSEPLLQLGGTGDPRRRRPGRPEALLSGGQGVPDGGRGANGLRREGHLPPAGAGSHPGGDAAGAPATRQAANHRRVRRGGDRPRRGRYEEPAAPRPPDHQFPTVAGWARGFERLRHRFDGGTGPMPENLVAEAEALFAELLASEGEPLLLHGDLHHENILSAEGGSWLAIDPKGVVGEAAYEAASLLHNPAGALDRPDPRGLLERRLDVLSEELGLDRGRVRAWGLAQGVLSAYWGLEDGGRVWGEALTFAGLLAEIRE